jgi:hypothetical protein
MEHHLLWQTNTPAEALQHIPESAIARRHLDRSPAPISGHKRFESPHLTSG